MKYRASFMPRQRTYQRNTQTNLAMAMFGLSQP